jgi:AcrR family transcriptional regulator
VVRRKVEVRREEILDAAVVEVGRSGFARLRVTDVAASLGCSSALVFYHFETKDRLLAEAFEHAVEGDLARLDQALTRGRDATDKVRRILRLYAPQGAAPGWTLQVDAWSEALRTPELRSTARKLDQRWKVALAEVIAQGVAEGTFACDDPADAAWRLTALLDGMSVHATVYGSLSRKRLAEWARAAAASELGVSADDLS